jgi:ArsR family transcriptional regulator
MGELLPGTPALRLETVVSAPLDLASALALLHRAYPGSGLDPWLLATRRALPARLVADLDLLHGFSGRLLYYMEEPVLRFDPLRADRRQADVADLLAFLDDLPPADYLAMVVHALQRVHRDLGGDLPAAPEGERAWRRALEPALTTATADEVLPLLADPAQLKRRTVRLVRGVWEGFARDDFAARLPELRRAAALAAPSLDRGVGLAFAELTGNRLPAPLVARLGQIERVAFCPSAHLGGFVSYVLYPPDLIAFFDAPGYLARLGADTGALPPPGPDALPAEALLDALRALADPTRLRILDLLGGERLYAQEIVGRLGLAQSAVSRHLAHLQRAGLVRVEPSRGAKYYAVDRERVDAVAAALRHRAGTRP